jgi:tetratricopeptide (TPR) repeat protein
LDRNLPVKREMLESVLEGMGEDDTMSLGSLIDTLQSWEIGDEVNVPKSVEKRQKSTGENSTASEDAASPEFHFKTPFKVFGSGAKRGAHNVEDEDDEDMDDPTLNIPDPSFSPLSDDLNEDENKPVNIEGSAPDTDHIVNSFEELDLKDAKFTLNLQGDATLKRGTRKSTRTHGSRKPSAKPKSAEPVPGQAAFDRFFGKSTNQPFGPPPPPSSSTQNDFAKAASEKQKPAAPFTPGTDAFSKMQSPPSAMSVQSEGAESINVDSQETNVFGTAAPQAGGIAADISFDDVPVINLNLESSVNNKKRTSPGLRRRGSNRNVFATKPSVFASKNDAQTETSEKDGNSDATEEVRASVESMYLNGKECKGDRDSFKGFNADNLSEKLRGVHLSGEGARDAPPPIPPFSFPSANNVDPTDAATDKSSFGSNPMFDTSEVRFNIGSRSGYAKKKDFSATPNIFKFSTEDGDEPPEWWKNGTKSGTANMEKGETINTSSSSTVQDSDDDTEDDETSDSTDSEKATMKPTKEFMAQTPGFTAAEVCEEDFPLPSAPPSRPTTVPPGWQGAMPPPPPVPPASASKKPKQPSTGLPKDDIVKDDIDIMKSGAAKFFGNSPSASRKASFEAPKSSSDPQAAKTTQKGSPQDVDGVMDTESSNAEETEGVEVEAEKSAKSRTDQTQQRRKVKVTTPTNKAGEKMDYLQTGAARFFGSPNAPPPPPPGSQKTKSASKSAKMTDQEALADSYRTSGNTQYTNNDYEGALKSFSMALKKAPEKWRFREKILGNRAATYFMLNRFVECIEDCDVAIRDYPTLLKLHLRRGKCFLKLGDLKSAREAVTRVLEAPTMDEKDRVDARKVFKSLQSAEGMWMKVCAAEDMKDYTSMQRIAEDLLSLCPHMRTAQAKNAHAMCKLRQWGEAKIYIEECFLCAHESIKHLHAYPNVDLKACTSRRLIVTERTNALRTELIIDIKGLIDALLVMGPDLAEVYIIALKNVNAVRSCCGEVMDSIKAILEGVSVLIISNNVYDTNKSGLLRYEQWQWTEKELDKVNKLIDAKNKADGYFRKGEYLRASVKYQEALKVSTLKWPFTYIDSRRKIGAIHAHCTNTIFVL